MRRLGISRAVLGAAALWMLAMTAAQAATTAVAIHGFAFDPATVTIRPGDTVTWTNKDNTAHTVTADDNSFDSDTTGTCTPVSTLSCINQNQTYSRSFNTTGVFTYNCKLHSNMHGTVVVQAPPAATTTTRAVVTTRATATTRAGANSTALGATTTTVTFAPGDPITIADNTSTSTPTGTAVAKSSGGSGNGSHAVAIIVAALSAVAVGGGALLWRLRPRG